MYSRGVEFFDELPNRSTINVDYRIIDQSGGQEIADAEQMVDELAGWQGRFWAAPKGSLRRERRLSPHRRCTVKAVSLRRPNIARSIVDKESGVF